MDKEKNMELWNALNRPPKRALKTISGGRLSGKTDINPQWRYEALTEKLGACGIGWKYDIVKVWNEPDGTGQIASFAEVHLYLKIDGEWSQAIPGIGGSMFVEKQSKGLYCSDECYKMAITDALSVAMKMVGVAADIYAGLWDGSKYKDVEKPAQPAKDYPKMIIDMLTNEHGDKAKDIFEEIARLYADRYNKILRTSSDINTAEAYNNFVNILDELYPERQ